LRHRPLAIAGLAIGPAISLDDTLSASTARRGAILALGLAPLRPALTRVRERALLLEQVGEIGQAVLPGHRSVPRS
jgi:hypothetical protein